MKLSKNYLNILKLILYFCLFSVFVFALGTNFNMIDFDIFNRLINGDYFISHHKLLQNDFLSCLPTHNSFDPEWLANILFSFVLKKFDAVGLNFLKCFLFLLASVSISFPLYFSKKKAYSICLLFPILFLISGSIFYLRCQIISFIFLPIFLYFLEKIKNSPKPKYFLFLALLNLIWQNCHGGFLISFVIIFLYIFGDLFNKKPVKKYFILFAILFFTVLINPWGVDYYGFLFESFIVDRNYISEWKSPILHNIQGAKIYVAFAFCSFIYFFKKNINVNKIEYSHLFLITFFFFYSLVYYKFSSLYMVVLIFSLIKYNKIPVTKKIFDVCVYSFVFVYSIFVFYSIPFEYSHIRVVSRIFPFYPVEFLKLNELKGNIYAPFGISGYISYKTYPNLKTFVDGRQEQVFSRKILKNNVDFMYQKNNMLVENTPVDYFLCQKGLAFENYVKESKKYKKIYEYGLYSVYSSDFSNRNYKIPNKDLFYYLDDIFVKSF